METLIINLDSEEDANALLEQLNHFKYIKNIVWTRHKDGIEHILPGEPLSDDVLNKLLNEAELETENITINDVRQKLNDKFKKVWKLNLGEEHI